MDARPGKMVIVMRCARMAAAAILAVLPSGCSVGDIRRSPAPAVTTMTVPASDPAAPYRVYRVDVPVPEDHHDVWIEFTDAGNGYALFARCDPSAPGAATPVPGCPSILLVTADGGRTWRERVLPHQRNARHQMYARGGSLLVYAEPHGWYLSTDRGQHFTRLAQGDRSAAAQSVTGGRFQVCCDDQSQRRVVDWAGDRARPLPAQPDLPDLRSVGYAQGRLVAVGVRAGRAYAAISTDHGRSWRTTPVPTPDGPLGFVYPELNGPDAWLIGQPENRTSFPWLWRLVGAEWRLEPATGHPSSAYYQPRAIGGGRVAVGVPGGYGAVGHGRFERLNWPWGGELRVIEDGAVLLLPDTGPEKTIWIGAGSGIDRLWTRVELVPDG